MCQMGDGTTNIGAFHESLNLAQLWRLPIVYVIVNNGLGMGTTVERAAAEPDLWKRGCSYRIPGERVDGDDVLAVRDAAREALAARPRRAAARPAGGGQLPAARALGGRPGAYRSRAETGRLRALDPVPAFRARLLEAGVLDEVAALRIEEAADQQVTAAVTYADDSPDPTPDQLFAHAYASPVPNTPRQLPGDPVVSGQ